MNKNSENNNSVSDTASRKISDNPVLLWIGGLGSIASILGLFLPVPLLEFVKKTISVPMGTVALVLSLFVVVLYVALYLNNRAHYNYYTKLAIKSDELKSENDKLTQISTELSNCKNLLIEEQAIVAELTKQNKEYNSKIKNYENLEGVILGLLKSGKPYSFSMLRSEIDDSVSDQSIQIALSGLGEKITANKPNSPISEYIINSA